MQCWQLLVLAEAQERLRKGVEALAMREAELEAIKSARYELETVGLLQCYRWHNSLAIKHSVCHPPPATARGRD
jgi:hypothetical protein